MYVTLVREETFTVRTQVHLPELNRRTSWGGEQGGASPLVHLWGTSLNTSRGPSTTAGSGVGQTQMRQGLLPQEVTT